MDFFARDRADDKLGCPRRGFRDVSTGITVPPLAKAAAGQADERTARKPRRAPVATATLAHLLRQDALFTTHMRSSLPDMRAVHEAQSTWLGVGLRGRSPSRGLPVDVLLLVFAQETLRRRLGLRQSHILVADSNARAAGDDELAVERLRARVLDTLSTVCDSFGFPVTVFAASEIPEAPRLAADATAMDASLDPYVRLQLAQMERMRQIGATVKIGWALPGGGFDERHFDELYRRQYRHPLAFVYTHGGRSLSRERPRSCPYACDRPADRLLLERGEDIAGKLALHARRDPDLVSAYRRLLARLARAHRRLVGPDRGIPPVARLQAILDSLPA